MFSSDGLFFISGVIRCSKVTNPEYGITVYLTYVNITTVQGICGTLTISLWSFYHVPASAWCRWRWSFMFVPLSMSCVLRPSCLYDWTVLLSKGLWNGPYYLEEVQVFRAVIGFKTARTNTDISSKLCECKVGTLPNRRSNPIFRCLFGLVHLLHCEAQFCIFVLYSRAPRFERRDRVRVRMGYSIDTGYPDWEFSWLSSVPTSKCLCSNIK